jgi:hypothetical protein
METYQQFREEYMRTMSQSDANDAAYEDTLKQFNPGAFYRLAEVDRVAVDFSKCVYGEDKSQWVTDEYELGTYAETFGHKADEYGCVLFVPVGNESMLFGHYGSVPLEDGEVLYLGTM